MSGKQTAAFSLVLDQEGATILQKAFEQGSDAGRRDLRAEYSALTPDLHVKITADFERVYTHFSAGLEAQIYWVRAGIDAGFEKLVQDGAIKIEVIDFEGAADHEAKEKWALDFFKDDLLAEVVRAVARSRPAEGRRRQPEGLDAVLDRLKKLKGGQATAHATRHRRTRKPGHGQHTDTPATDRRRRQTDARHTDLRHRRPRQPSQRRQSTPTPAAPLRRRLRSTITRRPRRRRRPATVYASCRLDHHDRDTRGRGPGRRDPHGRTAAAQGAGQHRPRDCRGRRRQLAAGRRGLAGFAAGGRDVQAVLHFRPAA